MTTPSFRLIASIALTLSLAALTGACTADAPSQGTGGVTEQDGNATCAGDSEKALYTNPGCGAAAPSPVCVVEHACAVKACSCNGKVILACYGYEEPFAYRFQNQDTDYVTKYFRDVGDPCDPNAPDGGAADAEAP